MKSRILVCLAVLAFLLSACTLSLAEDITPPPNYQSPTPGPTMSPLFPQSSPNLASGAAVFAEKCAACHGALGLGDGPMAAQLQKAPSAIGKPEIARSAAPANWYATVTQGNVNSLMPPFNATLSDQQRWDVVAYALSLGGNTSAETEKGKSVYEANCVQCHGPSGNAVDGVDFADQALMAKLTQADIANFINKGVGGMPGLGGLLADEDIYAAAAYVRTYSVSAGQVVAAPSATAIPEGTPAAPGVTETPAVAAEAIGSITGKVVNGSGGTIPSELKAVLHIFEHDAATQQVSEVSTQEAPIAADGVYKFDQVAMPTNRVFFVSVNYANTDFESEPIFPTDGQTSLDMPVTIYDTTTDTTGLVADQVHLLLDYSKPDVVQVVEFLVITNPGTKVVVAAESGGPVLAVVLPKGYTNLQFEQGALGDRYLKTETGFSDTTSVVPGTNQYQLVYAVDLALPKPGLFGGTKLEFSQSFPIKINSLSVLAPDGVTVEGANFTAGGLQDMGSGAQYQVFNSGSLEPGKELQVSASGTPKGSTQPQAATGNSSTQNIIIGMGAFGLVLILAGIWMYWRDRQRADDEDDDDDEEDDQGDDHDEQDEMNMDEIMDAIVALDDQFKAGNIQEAAYKERRADLKTKLKGIL